MARKNRSQCPIAFTLDLLGDKWSLLILRDVILFQKRYYHEFIESQEGISTNILANRLTKLEKEGLLKKTQDKNNKKKSRYSPTEKSLNLLPMIIEMVLWGYRYDNNTGAPKALVKKMRSGREAFIADIRREAEEH